MKTYILQTNEMMKKDPFAIVDFSQMVIIHFFQVSALDWFRYDYEFWQRTGQNHATSEYGVIRNFDTITKVGIFIKNLPKDVKPL